VVFERFKGGAKVPPDNRAMAMCPNGQLVVRYIKDLPSTYTNLTEPKSSKLEDLVKRVEQQVRMVARQHGAVGFHTLLEASLKVCTQKSC
jgi:flavorubredoxin